MSDEFFYAGYTPLVTVGKTFTLWTNVKDLIEAFRRQRKIQVLERSGEDYVCDVWCAGAWDYEKCVEYIEQVIEDCNTVEGLLEDVFIPSLF